MSDPSGGMWAVALNESAGSGLADPQALHNSIRQGFHDRGIQARFYLVTGPGIGETIRTAIRNGAAGIIVAGGDGTVSTAAAVLASGDVPLGILPTGTLNHFAKHLGIPLKLSAAIESILEGRRVRVDLGEVNGCYFINNSSIGGYPRVIRFRDHQRRHFRRHKWTAFILAFVRFLQRYRTMRVLLEFDGKSVVRKTPFVFVGNNEYDLGEALTPTRGTLTAGRLCVYTARCDHWTQFLRLFALLLVNRLSDAPEFEAHSVSEVRVLTQHRSLDVSRDGEIFAMEMPLHYRIHVLALAVIVPREPPVS